MKETLGSTPGPVAVLRGHDDAVISLKYTDSRHLYSGSANGKLLRWNLAAFRPDITLIAHDKSVISINDMGKGFIATSSRDSTVKIWDCTSFEAPVSLLRIGYDHFCNSCVGTIHGSSVLVTPGIKQSQIFAWDLRAPQIPVQVIEPDESVGMVTSLCSVNPDLNDDAPILCAGFEDGSVGAFDLRSANRLCSQRMHAEPVFALHARNSSKGLHVVSGGGDTVVCRSALTLAPSLSYSLSSSDTITLKQPGTSCVKYRRDGRVLVSAHWDHSVRVSDQKRLKPLAVFKHHRDSVYAVEFLCSEAPMSNVVCDGSAATSSCADTAADREGENLGGDSSEADAKDANSFSAGGELSAGCFATGSKDHTIALWNLFTETFETEQAL